jgi:hypothetical protein
MTQNGTRNYYTIIDSDGALVSYPDPYAGVTDQTVERAEEVERLLLAAKSDVEMGFMKMAIALDVIEREQLYRSRGYETMRQYVEGPEVDLNWRTATDMIRISREVLPLYESHPDLPTVKELGVSKVRALLPLLRLPDGEERFVAKAQQVTEADWTWKDTVAEVKAERGLATDPSKPLPVVFMAKVTVGEETTRVKVTGSDGNRHKDCGVLMIPNAWWPRWESRFGRFVIYEDTP